MSSLLHPIHGAREKCRPKHQVLVLRCYPKFQKNVQEVKPNSSELSYLLYYTSTRRTKLQKVGAFLEKRTVTDVWRLRLGNVQVTLQILTSIIEKAPRDLSLYGNYVLAILDTVVHSKDINMVEESIPTFEAYCKHVDVSALAADQNRIKQYDSLIQQYAAFSSGEPQQKGKTKTSLPESQRWRTVSLRAIRAVVGSDALATDASNQLNIVMPAILQNLHLEADGGLANLQQRAQADEKQSVEIARKRRMSTTTITTVDETDTNQAMASETTADADKAAEQEVRVLAVRCLRQIFNISVSSSRNQLRLATALVLRYIASKERPRPTSQHSANRGVAPDWATSLFETIARWTPVQDRFIIVLTAMETLVRSPIVEAVLEKQLVLATLIDWLLKSDINLIGLSVMDILLGLIRHTLLLLQLGGRDAQGFPSSQQADILGFYKDAQRQFDPNTVVTDPDRGRRRDSKESKASPIRVELLTVLQKAISDLATHIYYTDQISDMMTAILARLKPSAQSEIGSIAAAINDPAGATKAIADSANLEEDPSTDGFFSFTTARIAALKAVKDILTTANSRRTSGGVSAEARSRVGVQVWDGTQWLLKDEDPAVRIAYVSALVTWLKLETNKSDLLLPKDGARKAKVGKKDTVANGEPSIAKRAVSNASKREAKPLRSTFLQMLHLAIYDSAMERAESESDVLLLYILLWTLVERFGVNAIRTGLPMILNLQNAVLHEEPPKSARAKIHIASLVHGYLWAIAEKFDFEMSTLGHEVNGEISRRKRFGCWYDKIRFPPIPVNQISHNVQPEGKEAEVSQEAVDSIRPFLNIHPFVEEVASAYDTALVSPPPSLPSSPGRVFSVPTLGFGYGYNAAPAAKPSRDGQLPQKVKDEMCGQWSRELCIAAVDKENSPSVNGSRGGVSSGQRNHLTVMNSNDSGSGRETPNNAAETNGAVAPPVGLTSGLGSLSKYRNFSSLSSLKDLENSSRDSTMRIADLKRALAGGNTNFRTHSPLRIPVDKSRPSTRSSVNESMLSWDSADDESIAAGQPIERIASSNKSPSPGTSVQEKVLDQPTLNETNRLTVDPRLGSDVPPVPRIPSVLNLPGTWPHTRDPSPVRPELVAQEKENPEADDKLSPPRKASSRNAENSTRDALPVDRSKKKSSRPVSRAGASSILSDRHHPHSSVKRSDLSQFLAGISSGPEVSNTGNRLNEASTLVPPVGNTSNSQRGVIKPPY